jgi:predicted ATP-grasp superfamily ATP-dependent carboligase
VAEGTWDLEEELMRIFVYEYTCCGGFTDGQVANPLHMEGWAIVCALLEDFRQTPGVEVVTLLAERLPWEPTSVLCRRVDSSDEGEAFRDLARSADYSLVVAPEFDDLLFTRCSWVLEAGGRLLGPSPNAVKLAGDKLGLAQHLQAQGVTTPECRPASVAEHYPLSSYPLVWKPRYGAGSQATFLVANPEQLKACTQQAAAEGWRGEALVQRYIPGQPASTAFLVGPQQLMQLLPGSQRLSTDGRFHYLGGSIPLPAPLARRAFHLAEQAVRAVPGLLGYVGVDLVLGPPANGAEDAVIEINPRLTTSYIGLRTLCETNLAGLMLDVVGGKPVPARPTWRTARVDFDANGTTILQPHQE